MDDHTHIARPLPLPPGVSHRMGVLLYKVAQFVQAHLDAALEPHGLKTRHHTVLSVLVHRAAPMSQQALAEKLQKDRAVMVEIVDTLEEQGLVERRRNRDDRRLYDLTPTDAGRALVRELDAALDEMENAVFAPLSDAERHELHGLLARLLAPAP